VESTVPEMPTDQSVSAKWMRQQRETCTGTLSNTCFTCAKLLRQLGDEAGQVGLGKPTTVCFWRAAESAGSGGRPRSARRRSGCFSLSDRRRSMCHRIGGSHPRPCSLAPVVPTPLTGLATDVERVIASCDIAPPSASAIVHFLLLLSRLGVAGLVTSSDAAGPTFAGKERVDPCIWQKARETRGCRWNHEVETR